MINFHDFSVKHYFNVQISFKTLVRKEKNPFSPISKKKIWTPTCIFSAWIQSYNFFLPYHTALGVIAHKHINEFWLFNGLPPPLALPLSLSMVIFKERRACSTTDWWRRGRERGGRGSSLLFSLSFAQCLLLRLLWVFYKIKTSYSTNKRFSAARHASSTHCARAPVHLLIMPPPVNPIFLW